MLLILFAGISLSLAERTDRLEHLLSAFQAGDGDLHEKQAREPYNESDDFAEAMRYWAQPVSLGVFINNGDEELNNDEENSSSVPTPSPSPAAGRAVPSPLRLPQRLALLKQARESKEDEIKQKKEDQVEANENKNLEGNSDINVSPVVPSPSCEGQTKDQLCQCWVEPATCEEWWKTCQSGVYYSSASGPVAFQEEACYTKKYIDMLRDANNSKDDSCKASLDTCNSNSDNLKKEKGKLETENTGLLKDLTKATKAKDKNSKQLLAWKKAYYACTGAGVTKCSNKTYKAKKGGTDKVVTTCKANCPACPTMWG